MARNIGGGGVNGNATPAGLGTAWNRGVAGGVNGNATPAGLDMARNRGVAGGVNGNATQAGLGMARDRGVAGGFEASEGVYGRSKLGMHIGQKTDVHVGSKYLASPEERPSSRTWSVGGGLLAPGVSWSMARGSSWVAPLVSEGRGEPVPGWFIGGRGGGGRELAAYSTRKSGQWAIDGKNCEERMSKTVTTPCTIIILRGCYRHRPPFAGFYTRQVPRWSLPCTR